MRASKPRLIHYSKHSGYLNNSWTFTIGSNWLDSKFLEDGNYGYTVKKILTEGSRSRVTVRRYSQFNLPAIAVTESGSTRYSVITNGDWGSWSAMYGNYKVHRLGRNNIAIITFDIVVMARSYTLLGYIDVSKNKPCIVGLCLLPVVNGDVQLKKARSNPQLLTFFVSGLSGRREQLKVHIPEGQRPRIVAAPPVFPSVHLSPRECGIKSI